MNVDEKFELKSSVKLYNSNTVKFNGVTIKNDEKSLTMSQPHHVTKLSKLDPEYFTKQQLIDECARRAYTTAMCRPDITYGFSRLAQELEPTGQEVKDLKKLVKLFHESHNTEFKFVPRETKSIFIGLLVDVGLTTNKNVTLQLSFIMVLMGKQ